MNHKLLAGILGLILGGGLACGLRPAAKRDTADASVSYRNSNLVTPGPSFENGISSKNLSEFWAMRPDARDKFLIKLLERNRVKGDAILPYVEILRHPDCKLLNSENIAGLARCFALDDPESFLKWMSSPESQELVGKTLQNPALPNWEPFRSAAVRQYFALISGFNADDKILPEFFSKLNSQDKNKFFEEKSNSGIYEPAVLRLFPLEVLKRDSSRFSDVLSALKGIENERNKLLEEAGRVGIAPPGGLSEDEMKVVKLGGLESGLESSVMQADTARLAAVFSDASHGESVAIAAWAASESLSNPQFQEAITQQIAQKPEVFPEAVIDAFVDNWAQLDVVEASRLLASIPNPSEKAIRSIISQINNDPEACRAWAARLSDGPIKQEILSKIR